MRPRASWVSGSPSPSLLVDLVAARIHHLLPARAVAAYGPEMVLRVASVKDLRAVDVGFENVRVDAQRVAREHDEVRVLARLERADALVEVEHDRPRHREPVERLFAWK